MLLSDELFLAEEENVEQQPDAEKPWKILVVDDDEEVHNLTRLVLSRYTFKDRPLEFIDAFSAREAREKILEHPDTALILLDVVMEDEYAGLELARQIREEINNQLVRIILRTGQPGQAPETKVVMEYDINDYKEKTELTAKKLFTTVTASLRAYHSLITIANIRDELESTVQTRTAELRETNHRLEQTLRMIREDEEAGKRLQLRLLPTNELHIAPYTFSRYLASSLSVSGDFLDYFEIDSDHIGFYCADVSGHGVSSAFMTIILKTIISSYLRDFKAGKDGSLLDPAAILKRLNAELLTEDLGKHITLFFAILERNTNRLTFANAGQFPYPVLTTPGGQTQLLEIRGTPLGLFDFSRYENKDILLPDECLLTIWSDGILEILPGDETTEKLERLRFLTHNMEHTLSEVISLSGIDLQVGLPDDITVLMIRRRKPNG